MIGQGLGRLALAEKLSIEQLQQAIQNKTVPAYIGIPLLEEKMMFEQRMRSAGQGIAPEEPPIAEQVMAQASQMGQPTQAPQAPQVAQMSGGIDELPIPEAKLAGGGIVAFQEGGEVPQRVLMMMNGQERSEYARTGKIPSRLQSLVSAPAAANPMPTPTTVEDTIAQAQRGEGPNVSRPPAPADVAMVPPGGPVIPRPTADVPALGQPPAPADNVQKAARPAVAAEPTPPAEPFDPISKLEEYERRIGILADPDKETRDELAAATKRLGEDKDNNVNMALIKAGLAIMGGESPFAFVNIAKGGMAGLESYGKSEAERRKEERELMKARADLQRADEARRQGRLKEAIKLEQDYLTNALNIRRTEATELQARASMITAQRGPAELQTYDTWAAQRRAAGKDDSIDAFRESAPTVQAARIKLVADVTEAVNKSFEPGGAYHSQYKKILKDKGQAEADRFKQGKVLENISLATQYLGRGEGATAGGSGQGLGGAMPQLRIPPEIQKLLQQYPAN
jgi:hypothetical protein